MVIYSNIQLELCNGRSYYDTINALAYNFFYILTSSNIVTSYSVFLYNNFKTNLLLKIKTIHDCKIVI